MTSMREKGIHKIEVHVAAVCVCGTPREPRVLGLHRANSRSLFPGYWEGSGGQVHAGESFEDAIRRHLRDEAGIENCNIVCPIAIYTIDPGPSGASERIPGLRFLVTVDEDSPVTIDPKQHQALQWIPAANLPGVNWIPSLLPQIERGLTFFRHYAEHPLIQPGTRGA